MKKEEGKKKPKNFSPGLLQINNIRHFFYLLPVFILLLSATNCQKNKYFSAANSPSAIPFSHIQYLEKNDTLDTIAFKASRVIPARRQLNWQQKELIAFIHFGLNTFTDSELGEGHEDPSLFNPTAFNPRQWTRILKEAGFKMVILTAKHHDGFCLWPSKVTSYSVKSSRWRNGHGDVVKEVAMACREEGLDFGFYLSPWDRHERSYGTPEYNKFFLAQLQELLTDYGPISEVWFDGYCGEGPAGRKQIYDWNAYYQLIRKLQPEAVIAIMGPDVRWVGNESGEARESEWSVLPLNLTENELSLIKSGKTSLERVFQPENLMADDLGSLEKIKSARALFWYPAEVDVSIRPGWFYHSSQDNQVKSAEELARIYFHSVGRNAVLLLNIPPDRRGLIAEKDARAIKGMHQLLAATFKKDLAFKARVQASSQKPKHRADFLVDHEKKTYWEAEEGKTEATLEFLLAAPSRFDCLELQEEISRGQRVEEFRLEVWKEQSWITVARGTTIGYKRLITFPPVYTDKVKLVISKSRANPVLKKFALYQLAFNLKN